MPITRDPDFPAETAALFQAFNRLADGHTVSEVLEASFNFTVAAINYLVREQGGDEVKASAIAEQLAKKLPLAVADQWSRLRSPHDMEVHRGN